MRSPSHLVPVACLALGAAACGGGGGTTGTGAASPPPPPAVDGTYTGETAVDATTIPGQQTTAPRSMQFAFSCADATCGRVYQRTDSTRGLQAQTWLFDVTGDAWRSATVERGACTAPATGEYEERLTWTWTRAADGAMRGGVDQAFTGCAHDGTAHLTTTVAAARTGDLPYVTGEDAASLAGALTAYDVAYRGVETAYPTCREALYAEGRTVEGGTCFQGLLEDLTGALTALQGSLDARPVAAAAGSCGTALGAVSTGQPLSTAAAARTAFVTAASSGDYQPPSDALEPAVTALGELGHTVTAVALQCLAPGDLRGLGADGVLAVDVDGYLRPAPAA